MKPLHKIRYAIGTIAVMFTVGCASETLLDVEADTVENPDYEIIRSLGFNTEDIIETDDSYIVEGDMVFEKNSMQDYLGKTRQLYNGVISSPKIGDIKVYIYPELQTNNGGGVTWYQAVVDAMSEWNNILDCAIRYSTVSSAVSADVVVRRNSAIGGNIIARAAFPWSGNPGRHVEIGFNFDHHSAAQKKYIMVHEFGHNLGFAHMDESGRQVPGTPTSDPQSIMSSTNVGYRSWGNNGFTGNYDGFTPYDIVAAQTLYGTEWNIAISGMSSPSVYSQINYSVPASLPSGMTFSYWEVAPNTCTVTGGTNNRNLNITFNSQTQYTLKANLVLHGSVPYVVTKTINVLPPPPETPAVQGRGGT